MLENYSTRLKYIRNLVKPQSKILNEINESIIKNDFPIHINPEEGKLLQLLIQLTNSKKIVELGTFLGYSTIWMAEALDDQGKIYTIEHDAKRYELANNNFIKYLNSSRIISLKGKAIDILNNITEQSPFDMIFIDADKPSYSLYLDWAEDNIKKGGLIVADDTFLSGAVYLDIIPKKVKKSTADLMRRFNERIADSNKYQSIMIPNERGLTIAMKNF